MSVGMGIESPDLLRLQQRLLEMTHLNFHSMLENIGGIAESQTRRRLSTEKAGPDGRKWDDWSEKYAASKHGPPGHDPHPHELTSSQGHTLLELTGALIDSQQFDVTLDEVEFGSNLVYANRQNKKRPFLGFSPRNEHEIVDAVEKFLHTHVEDKLK